MRVTFGNCVSLLLSTIVAAGLAGCRNNYSATEYVQDARTLHAKHDNQAAIIQLRNALALEPNRADARLLLGTLYNETGDPTSAEIELRQAQQLASDPALVVPELARALLGRLEYKKVLDELDSYQIKHQALTPELLTLQGHARLLMEDQDARSSYLSALEKDPTFVDAQLGLARLTANEGKTEEALHQTSKLLQQVPRNADVWLFRGDLLRAQAADEDAETSYRRALEIKPSDAAPRLRMADLYIESDRLDAARAQIEAVQKENPQNLMAFYQQAVIYMKEKKYSDARDSIQQVRKRAPHHLPSMLVSGMLAYINGFSAQADREFTVYLSRVPNNASARKLLAANALRANQPDKALETLAPLLLAGNDLQAFAMAGEAALWSNQLAKANEYLTRAAMLAPQDPSVRTQLGVSRLAAGDFDSGIANLESASALATDSSRTDLILVLAHLKRKEYDKAFAVVDGFQKKQPANPAAFNLRAHVLLDQGNTEQARRNLEAALELRPDYFPAANSLAVLDARENNLGAARRRLVVFLEKNPGNVSAMLALENVASAAGNHRERLEWLEKAIEAAPFAMRPRILLTNYHLQKKEFRKAVAAAREAQSIEPFNAEVLALLGTAQTAAGDKDDAVTTYHGLAKLLPSSPGAHYSLAMALVEVNDAAAARTWLARALALQPDYLDAEVAMALLENQAGHHRDALKLTQRIRSRLPGSPVGALLEGDLRMSQSDFPGAFDAYDAALRISKRSDIFVKAHMSLVRGGQAQKAEAVAAKWLQSHPGDNAVRLYLAAGAMKDAKNHKAIAYYQEVLAREPRNIVALNNVAWLYQQQNDPRALPAAEEAVKLHPDDAMVVDTLGWILVQQGHAARGVEVLQRAVALLPQSTTLRYHLAVGYEKAGNRAGARGILDVLLEAEIDFPERQEAVALRGRL